MYENKDLLLAPQMEQLGQSSRLERRDLFREE